MAPLESVGVAALRWGGGIRWPLDLFLAELSYGNPRDVAKQRREFAKMVRARRREGGGWNGGLSTGEALNLTDQVEDSDTSWASRSA